MCLWRKPYSFSLIWLSRTIGSIKRTNFISVDKTLSIFSEQQLKVNFSFSMVSCMKKQTVADPDLQISGGGWSCYRYFGPHFGLSIRGRGLPWFCHCRRCRYGIPWHLVLYSLMCLCSIKERLEQEGKVPTYYRRFVDDTPTVMPNKTSAGNLLETLNQFHSSVMFTMEIESNGMLPFLGTQLLNRFSHVETKVYLKPTNTGLLLHHKSHVDVRYKWALLRTMLESTFRLSSNWSYFSEECMTNS